MLFTQQIGEVCSLVVTIGYCLFEDSFPTSFFSRSFLCSYSFSSLGFPLPNMEAEWRLSARSFTGSLTVRGCNFNLGRLSKSSVNTTTQFTFPYLFIHIAPIIQDVYTALEEVRHGCVPLNISINNHRCSTINGIISRYFDRLVLLFSWRNGEKWLLQVALIFYSSHEMPSKDLLAQLNSTVCWLVVMRDIQLADIDIYIKSILRNDLMIKFTKILPEKLSFLKHYN